MGACVPRSVAIGSGDREKVADLDIIGHISFEPQELNLIQ